MGYSYCWHRSVQAFVCMVAIALCGVGVAQAQFKQVWAVEELPAAQTTNLFATWAGQVPIDGLYVDLPPGCQIMRAVVLRKGYEPVPLAVAMVVGQPQRYRLEASRPLHGRHELVVTVATGEQVGVAEWTMTPFTFEDRRRDLIHVRNAYRIQESLWIRPRANRGDNQALAFAEGLEPPLVLRSEALPPLGRKAPYTVELWMKTTGLNEVVVSTWNGDEGQPYPLELVVDAAGRLMYYHGEPGQHHAMRAPRPVADGRWHHVAVSHEAEAGWTRLIFDGEAVDSLFTPVSEAITATEGLALGGRLPLQREAPVAALGGYSGLIDEFHLWPLVRPTELIRQARNQPLKGSSSSTVLALNFDQPLPAPLVQSGSRRVLRTASDLVFYFPVRDLSVNVEARNVALTWATDDTQTARFVIERSRDGRYYEAIGAVETTGLAAETGRYQFEDLQVADQVLFFRIRQHFKDGTERLSRALKVGVGEEQAQRAILVGNYPNPFNPTTTITYELMETQHVRVTVSDLAGQLVAVLVDEVRSPGYYEVQFEAADLPSGPYFIRMRTPEGVQTRQMILAK